MEHLLAAPLSPNLFLLSLRQLGGATRKQQVARKAVELSVAQGEFMQGLQSLTHSLPRDKRVSSISAWGQRIEQVEAPGLPDLSRSNVDPHLWSQAHRSVPPHPR